MCVYSIMFIYIYENKKNSKKTSGNTKKYIIYLKNIIYMKYLKTINTYKIESHIYIYIYL